MPRRKRTTRFVASGTPYGKNSLPSQGLYKERSLYKRKYAAEENMIDFWYGNALYGRVDEAGNAIYPSERYLKEVVGGDCLYCLNFVSDAYNGFINEFMTRNRIDPRFKYNKKLSPDALIPRTAWLSINKLYHQHVNKTYETFTGGYLRIRNRHSTIDGFDRFVEHFVDFLEPSAMNSPFTRTGIITGLSCTPNISGLCIEVGIEDYSDDRTKDVDFFMNYLYDSFRMVAQEHGFMVDKNAPWRLVFDFNSEKAKRYMRPYGISSDNLFDTYYHKSYTYDVPSLKVYLKEFYNSFAASRPGRSRTLLGANFENTYDDEYWIRVYSRIRQSEVSDKLNVVKYNKLVKDATTIKRRLNVNAALKHINKQFLGQLTPTV